MSGTSLDGMDIACCNFIEDDGRWRYSVIKSTTIEYTPHWKQKLETAHTLSPEELTLLDFEYGHLIGTSVRGFLDSAGISNNLLVASHGHTVFHMPGRGYTLQIGHGGSIAASAGFDTVCDFRSTDVALGGQGAPLVPAGDRLLFHEYDLCLNLGGFANISMEENGNRIAFDICPFNFVINHLVRSASIPMQGKNGQKLLEYDPGGSIGRKGRTDTDLLNRLNNISYYRKTGPKSLGREWATENILPLLNTEKLGLEVVLNTYYHHVAMQIAKVTGQKDREQKLLITGGGAKNSYFIECLKEHLPPGVLAVITGNETIEMKEAIIFAFLGLLRYLGRPNCLSSATGAGRDSTGGCIYHA